jgi:hypothetical protein
MFVTGGARKGCVPPIAKPACFAQMKSGRRAIFEMA